LNFGKAAIERLQELDQDRGAVNTTTKERE
jgi:hypothetical protein